MRSILKKILFLKSYYALYSDLRFIDDSIWIAAFAIPQVVLVSADLIKWYPLIEKSYFPNFNWATISEGKAGFSVTLGDTTFIVTKKEMTEVFSKKEPIAYKCKSFELIREKFVAFTYWVLNWR